MERVRRPTVFLAYGEDGLEWLMSTAAEVARINPLLGEMIEARVIQLWISGVEAVENPLSPVFVLDGATDALSIQRRLHIGRADRHRQRFNLELAAPTVVIERWSAFRPGWEDRTRLRDAFSVARHVDCDPGKEIELDFQWISLADAVRAAGRPDPDVVERIRTTLGSETIHDISVFIDRATDAGGGLVDEDLADHCFHRFAVCLLTSDLAFPTPEAGDGQRSDVLMHDQDLGLVHPLSVVALHHPPSEFRDAYAEVMEVELLTGDPPHDHQPQQELVASLDELVAEEADAMRSGRARAQDFRLRRMRAAGRLVRMALLRRTPDSALDELLRARRAVGTHLRGSGSSAAISAGFLLFETEIARFWPAAVLLLVVVGGLAVWQRRQRVTDGDFEAPVKAEIDLDFSEVGGQWEGLIDATAAVLHELKDRIYVQKTRVDRVAVPASWERLTEHPYEWKLGRAAIDPGNVRLFGRQGYESVARRAVEGTLDGAAPGDAFTSALRAEATAVLEQHDEFFARSIADSLRTPISDALRDGLQRVPLLARTGPNLQAIEVLWIFHPDLEIRQQLLDLEAAKHRSLARFLTSDDRDRTVRIMFGEPVRWSDVLSLSFLRAS
jgi:hypothetical protein